MKAIRIHEHGGTDKLQIDDLPIPEPAADEVLIRVKNAALNHLDLWVRQGLPGIDLPLIMGSDGAGIIERCGELFRDKPGFEPGREVLVAPIRSCGTCFECVSGNDNLCDYFQIPGEHLDGAQAEFITVPGRYIFPKPQHFSWPEAAAFPLATLTAWHMLRRKVQLQPEMTVLVMGASSGVGSAAIQIARHSGCRVITTAGSETKAQMALELGAEKVILYKSESISAEVKEWTRGRGVDVVVEHTGAATWPEALRSVKKNGSIVTCGATTGPRIQIDLRALFIKHQRVIGSTMGTLQDFHEMIALAGQGRLKAIVDRVFHFTEIAAAHEYLASGIGFGKVVLEF